MDPGTLTKVLRDFFTTVDGELSLNKGEYFLVIFMCICVFEHFLITLSRIIILWCTLCKIETGM